jgi:RNA polymerase sigma-70 factor (family 1)
MMTSKNENELLFSEIRAGSVLAFNKLFEVYYNKLLSFSKNYIPQPQRAEEIISELFVKIWLKRNQLPYVINLDVYLYVCVKNACLNDIRAQKRHSVLNYNVELNTYSESFVEQNDLDYDELKARLDKAVESLPDQRKLIFKMIKYDGLKTKDVAVILDLSTRTVENQLYKAIKHLAQVLTDYLGYHPQKTRFKKDMHAIIFIF